MGGFVDLSSISFAVYIAIIPSIILCLYVYHMDVIEKEPIRLLFILFFIGVLITLPARFVERLLITSNNMDYVNYYANYKDSFFLSFAIIAVVEEGYKYLVLLASSWKNKEFDYKYDAIVYSVFISLGFATLENILYIQNADFTVVLLRGVISVPAHAFFAIASGFFVGFAKEASLKKEKKKVLLYLLLALIVPIILHGTFDFLLLTENSVMFGICISFVTLLYIVSYYAIIHTNNKGKIIKKR